MRAPFVLALGALTVGVAAGCAMFEGLQDHAVLVDPPARALHLPGVRVSDGNFERLTLLAEKDDGIAFAAVRVTSEERRLFLFHASWGDLSRTTTDVRSKPERAITSCDAGLVEDFEAVDVFNSDSNDVAVEIRTFFDDDGDGLGALRFLNDECEETGPSLEDVDWNRRVFGKSSLLLAGDTLYRTTDDLAGAEIMASSVRDFAVVDSRYLFTIHADRVERRDIKGQDPVAGVRLVGAAFERPHSPRDRWAVSLRTPDGVWEWTRGEDAPERVTQEGCALVVGQWARAYLRPCEEGKLVVEVQSEHGNLSREYDSRGLRPGQIVRVFTSGGRSRMLVWLRAEGADPRRSDAVGTLLGVEWLDGATELPPLEVIDEKAEFWSPRDFDVSVGLRCRESGCDEYEGALWQMDLSTFRAKSDAARVVGRVLLSFDDGSAREFVVQADGRASVETKDSFESHPRSVRGVADGLVGVRTNRHEPWAFPEAVARTWRLKDGVLSPYYLGFVRRATDGGAGDLHLFDSVEEQMTPPVARDVMHATVHGLTTPTAVVFRKREAPQDLSLLYAQSELEESIPNVREFASREWVRGLLYATTGEDAALWYAPPKY